MLFNFALSQGAKKKERWVVDLSWPQSLPTWTDKWVWVWMDKWVWLANVHRQGAWQALLKAWTNNHFTVLMRYSGIKWQGTDYNQAQLSLWLPIGGEVKPNHNSQLHLSQTNACGAVGARSAHWTFSWNFMNLIKNVCLLILNANYTCKSGYHCHVPHQCQLFLVCLEPLPDGSIWQDSDQKPTFCNKPQQAQTW